MESAEEPRCRNLVLDAGPLLSLSPLRGLAATYLTVPQVLSELKDHRAREHFERLGLMSGVKVEVRSPDAASMALVIQWAKKTGDYAVLSHPDLCVIALTHTLHEEDKKAKEKAKEESALAVQGDDQTTITEAADELTTAATTTVTVEDLTDALDGTTISSDNLDNDQEAEEVPTTDENKEDGHTELEPLDVELIPIKDDEPLPEITTSSSAEPSSSSPKSSSAPIYDDPSDSDDGEGEWITPANFAIHKSRALDLLPEDGVNGKGKKKAEPFNCGCMTADFAMQNVLLQMGLNLVGLEGKRIEKVKSWVLRCHACFKICKDSSKKFCPSCGNPTLLRASVTVASPTASADAPAMQIHLKPNFQYKIRGTKYSIPAPKGGSAKTGAGTGLILREDQVEYMRAKKRADGKREREEERLTKGILGRGARGETTGVSSWMDPDWMPEILSVGSGGRGRSTRSAGMDGDMPQIGYGRKNPNEKKRKK
ncbi:Nin one binding Zn-ribbon like-domain-containing protein [Crassisporium funariophilum]|nr:Nin one binding Zn-ribbon like-domain-containing protein [Crassisporium funariophilum]